jgi:pimeloyl-ACP methyl ester carboxylesterase
VASSPPDLVILVHGLWMSGLELVPLKNRLHSDFGFEAVPFSYPSVSGSMLDHVKALREFAQAQKTVRMHFVGHSLGGLVVLNLLEATADLPPGRAVLLGAPVQGSRAAQGFGRWPLGRAMLGIAMREEFLSSDDVAPRKTLRAWNDRREVGVIAGSSGLGLGRFVARLDGEHDGTVMVEETVLPGARDHLVLPVTHTSMLFSGQVAAAVAGFLRTGHFADV